MTTPSPAPSRPRRTLLFVPGDDPRKIAKAAGSGADSVVLDWEDGVAANRKSEAREATARALGTVDFGATERLIRINPVGTGLGEEDLQSLRHIVLDGVVIPKVEASDEIREVSRALASKRLPILALIETARGVVNLKEIAASHDRIEALLFGAEDLVGDLGAVRTAEGREALWSRGAVVVTAAAFSLQAIDTVFVDLQDEEGLRRESRLAATMGYSGKMVIHPKQVPVIAQAFTPSAEEVDRARRLVEAHARLQEQGTGVFVFEGRMVDRPMVRAAERLLARARPPVRR